MSTSPAACGWSCLTRHQRTLRLDVHVQPNAKRTQADGLYDGALRVRLCAPPVDGKANQRLIEWLASELGCAQRDLRIAKGTAARRKSVEIELPLERLEAWLGRVLGVRAATSPTPSPPAR